MLPLPQKYIWDSQARGHRRDFSTGRSVYFSPNINMALWSKFCRLCTERIKLPLWGWSDIQCVDDLPAVLQCGIMNFYRLQWGWNDMLLIYDHFIIYYLLILINERWCNQHGINTNVVCKEKISFWSGMMLTASSFTCVISETRLKYFLCYASFV